MPRQYEAIRNALVSRGKDYDEAQRIAAATYNKRHPGHPMGSGREYDKHAHVRAALKRKTHAK